MGNNLPAFKKFAFLGTNDQFNMKLRELKSLAEEENWTSQDSQFENDILFNYIMNTFSRIEEEEKILFSKCGTYCCFNTGLMTENGEDIIASLCENTNLTTDEKWFFEGFRCVSDRRFLEKFTDEPRVAEYFDNPAAMYFNPNYKISVNTDHILNDNIGRFPDEISRKGQKYLCMLFNGSLELTKKKIKRNYRLVVPQYYNQNITYLLPIDLDEYRCALAIELLDNKQYRANTILTLEMAYNNARLLMKPESDWLNIEKSKIKEE